MRITNAVYLLDSLGFPLLSVILDGHPVRIYHEQKFLKRRIVLLPPGALPDLDPITIRANRKDARGELELTDAVEDRRLASMVKQYQQAVFSGMFHPGPVDVPKEGVR